MRKDLTYLGLALLLSSSTFASGQEKMPVSVDAANRYKAINGNEKNVTPLYRATSVKGGQNIQELEYRVLDSLVNAFSMYSTSIQPFVYSPEADRLAFIHRGAENTPVGEQTSKDDIYITASEDWGATWTRSYGPLRPDGTTLGARYPSLEIVNPAETGITYVYSFPLVTNPNSGAGEWGWGTVIQGILEENNPNLPYGEPNNGTSAGGVDYFWGTDTKMTSIDQNTVLQVAGLTAIGNPASENNAIGLRIVDLQGSNPFLPVIMPPQWGSEQFMTPTDLSTNPGGRMNTVAGLDHDAQGNIYLGVAGRFLANNPDQEALPGVSISSDNGATWTDFDVCPASLITDYGNSLNAIRDSSGISYSDGFIVTGNGNFSFVTSFSFKTLEDLVNSKAHIVEIYKENGSWGIRKIADYSNLVWNFFSNEEDPSLTDPTQMGNELQIVKTVDGSTLMVKWIDFVDYTLDGTTQPSSDVFISARKLDGNWTAEPLNITSTPMVNKITWLPNLIPNDLTNIPMLSIQAEVLESETTEIARFVTSQRHLVSRKQYIVESRFNAAQTVGVNEEDPAYAALQLGNTYPNPVAAQGTIQFTLPSSGHATLELHNVMGQKVLSLVDGFTSAGTHYVNINTNNLSAGTYYYTLKWNGKSETRMMSVVR